MSKRISELPAVTEPASIDLLETVQGGTSKRVTVDQLLDFFASAFGQQLMQLADAPAGRTALGLGTVATDNTVPLTRGGTGATSAAGARTALGLKSAALAALLGTVAQTAGVPNGDVFEGFTNGTDVGLKFANGLILLMSIGAAGSSVLTNSSNISRTLTLPTGGNAFTRVDFVVPASRGPLGTAKAVTTVGLGAVSTSSIQLSAYSLAQFVSGDTANITLDALVIGRWF